ncbi:uncharacterized protein TNCV_1537731 [Trichonephila clavipes]|nr:uncharacterized protein TNCV_1537731 [Trichonephila clavipes]
MTTVENSRVIESNRSGKEKNICGYIREVRGSEWGLGVLEGAVLKPLAAIKDCVLEGAGQSVIGMVQFLGCKENMIQRLLKATEISVYNKTAACVPLTIGPLQHGAQKSAIALDLHLLMHLWAQATRGLLATDHIILNHGQVTWTTPELAPPLLTTTPHQQEDVSAFNRFNVHRCSTLRVFSGTGLELVTRQATIRYLYHSATAATSSRHFSTNSIMVGVGLTAVGTQTFQH